MYDLNDLVVSQVRDASDIVEIVSQVTPLKPAGKSHKGLCPFHREKSPSFHVDRDKGLFYCFGCGSGGDVFKFVMLTERFTFPEAVEHIAGRVGIELPRKKRGNETSGKEILLQVIEDASEAFHQAIGWTPNAAEAYLEKRKVDRGIWAKYGFGYAPESWDYIISRLGRKHPLPELEKAGLILPRKAGNGFYDRFRNRLIVPIHSESGSVIGFGGRTLDGSDPKYLNSPESPIFNKSNLLYNLFRAKDAMRKLERAILVEGYFDCIALDHAGIPGVVASMGTSLTTGQASALRKYAKRVVICYDGDEAGQRATIRAAPILLSAGVSVDVVNVGGGLDPDTYLVQFGLEKFMELLGQARDVFDFALETMAADAPRLSGREKSELVEKFIPILASVADPVVRNEAAQKVADGLRIEFDAVWSRVRRPGSASGERREPSAPIATGEKRLLQAALRQEFPDAAFDQIREEFFEDPACLSIFRAVKSRVSEGQPLDFSGLTTDLKGEVELTRLSELALAESDPFDAGALEDLLRHMERRYLERRQREIQREIQEAERAGDHKKLQSLDGEKTELMRRRLALK